MKRRLILLTLLLVLISCSAAAGSAFRDLKTGDTGADVLRLKQRMYQLGYFTSYNNLTEKYNGLMAERVCLLQRLNGLEETGIATAELQELIYSDACVWQAPTPAPSPSPVPSPTPAPTPAPPALPSDLPATDEAGFLPEGAEAYIHADRENGLWLYLSAHASVKIVRYSDPSVPRIWFETEIRLREPLRLRSMLSTSSSGKLGTRFVKPAAISKAYDAIVLFSDDFFGYRKHYKQRAGIVIRDGTVYSDATRSGGSKSWPPLDVLAVFDDGHMETFESDAHTADEYLAMGVKDTYAFGPILVRDGQVSEDMGNWSATDRSPRQVLGFTEDGTVKVLTVLGRRKDAVGTTIRETAEMIRRMGVKDAINLDGGNTVSLMFMGDLINRPETVRNEDIRSITGMIGFSE